jgi:2,3-bisphosphoglycerate-dependent phosphoglycerate mutase
MNTIVYMVRHAESPYIHGEERSRGLSEKGRADAARVTEILALEPIHAVVSSPYARAIQTVEGIAAARNLEIEVYEDLRERQFAAYDYDIAEEDFWPSVKKMFADPDFALPGGESNRVARSRAVKVLEAILDAYAGKRFVIGTHGNIMTLMISHYDDRYGVDFLIRTSKPDIYKLEFDGDKRLIAVERLWRE